MVVWPVAATLLSRRARRLLQERGYKLVSRHSGVIRQGLLLGYNPV
jgi:hypothetical protein